MILIFIIIFCIIFVCTKSVVNKNLLYSDGEIIVSLNLYLILLFEAWYKYID